MRNLSIMLGVLGLTLPLTSCGGGDGRLEQNAHDLIPAIFDWMDGKIEYDPSRVALVGASNGGRGVFFSAVLVGGLDENWLVDSQGTKDFLTANGVDATLEVLEGQGHILSLNMETVMDWIDEALGH